LQTLEAGGRTLDWSQSNHLFGLKVLLPFSIMFSANLVNIADIHPEMVGVHDAVLHINIFGQTI
jgi:hypothetical protein